MFFRRNAPLAQEFHVVVFSRGEVVGEELIHGVDETVAFGRAEDLAAEAGAKGLPQVTAYLLDREQAFVGSVTGSTSPWRDAA